VEKSRVRLCGIEDLLCDAEPPRSMNRDRRSNRQPQEGEARHRGKRSRMTVHR
jgi:hypothetical protein